MNKYNLPKLFEIPALSGKLTGHHEIQHRLVNEPSPLPSPVKSGSLEDLPQTIRSEEEEKS